MKLMNNKSKSILSAFLISGSICHFAHAEMLNGSLTGGKNEVIEYQYETSSGHYGLKLKPLFKPELISKNIGFNDLKKCELLNGKVKEGIGEGSLYSLLNFEMPVDDLDIKARMVDLDRYHTYKELVASDLKKRGINTNKIKDKTLFTNFKIQLEYDLRNDSLLAMTKKQEELRFILDDLIHASSHPKVDSSAVYVSIHLDGNRDQIKAKNSNALIACDLMSGKLKLRVSYRYDNTFWYSTHGIQTDVLSVIRSGLVQNSSFIREIEQNQKYMTTSEARILAASSLLTTEILKTKEKSKLLQPSQYLVVFQGMVDSSGEVKSTYSSDSLADELGVTTNVKFDDINGVFEL